MQRPRHAIELRPGSVVAARADDAAAPIASAAYVRLQAGSLIPSLKPANISDRVAVIAAIRSTMEKIGAKTKDVTVVIPDAATRVVLLEFDTLPSKADDAQPVVRFRLKRALPFDADSCALSYQVMSQDKAMTRVLAVAMPHDVRDEYETVVREAGYEPGAMIPSTLATLAALDPADTSSQLLLNVDLLGITTAIARGDLILLHRTVEFTHHQLVHAPEVLPAPMTTPAQVEVADAMAEAVVAEVDHLSDADEIARALSVAEAYYEDTLAVVPNQVLISGSWPVNEVAEIANEVTGSIRLKEIVQMSDLLAEANAVPRNLLSGVRGALRG